VDYFGAVAYHYKKTSMDQSEEDETAAPIKLRYCENSIYGYDTFSYEPRPKCPVAVPYDRRLVYRGMLTLYKVNIQPKVRSAIMCQRRITTVKHIQKSSYNYFYDRVTYRESVTPELCAEMVAKKKAPTGFFEEQPSLDGKVRILITDNDKTYDDHPDVVGTHRLYGTFERNVTDYVMEFGTIRVIPPKMTIHSAWAMTIPKNRLRGTFYRNLKNTIIWDRFGDEELCTYVPRLTLEVNAINYAHPTKDVNQTFFFIW
jgi:hypothetical protein